MLFEFNLYSSLLLVFFVHIIVYAVMLWRRGLKQESLPDKLLGTFLLVSALLVVPWMTGFAGWYDEEDSFYREFLFYFPFVHGLLIGPLLYLYVKSITNFNYRLSKNDQLHFVPALLYVLWSVLVVVVDKLILKEYYLMNGENDPDFDAWYQWLQKISIIVYLVMAIRYYRQYLKFGFYEFSFAESASLGWLRNFLFAFAILTILPLIQDLLNLVPAFARLDYKGSWYYFFAYALVVYYIAINGYSAVSIPLRRLLFEPQLLLQYQSTKLLAGPVKAEDASFEVLQTSGEDELITGWKNKLAEFIAMEKVYEEPELTLTELAKRLSTNSSVLSKVVNKGFGQSFNDFINQYRVNAVTEKLRNGEQGRQTLLGIAFDCGFNSKATFNRAFKKATGISPKDWIQKNAV